MAETKFFKTDHMVVITSKKAINMMQWRNYLIDNWDNLLTKNGRVLILGGVHGTKDGKVSMVDDGLARDIEGQIGVIYDRKAKHIERDQIEFKFENVSSHLDKSQLDQAKLTKAIEDFQPTILILAFCWTHHNELNDIFRAAGIYSIMIMQRDRADITEGKCIFLDHTQQNLVKKIAHEKPQHLFLWGSHGTGKTVVLLEALRMKLAQYNHTKVKIKSVILTSYFEDCQAVLDIFARHINCVKTVDIKIYTGYKKLLKAFGIEMPKESQSKEMLLVGQKMVEKVGRVIEKETDNDQKTIIVADEVFLYGTRSGSDKRPGPDMDFEDFASDFKHVDVLMALSPLCYDSYRGTWCNADLSEVIPPSSPDVLSCQLVQKHRNCLDIVRLLRFFRSHAEAAGSGWSVYDSLFSKMDKVEPDSLPSSAIPVWIKLHEQPSQIEVLEYVESKYLLDAQGQNSVTVLFDYEDESHRKSVYAGESLRAPKPPESHEVHDIAKFCTSRGWKLIIGSEFMRGQEDKTVILMYNGTPANVVVEALTRARNNLIIITRCLNEKDGKENSFELELQMAVDHQQNESDGSKCRQNLTNCEFVEDRRAIVIKDEALESKSET